MEHATIEWIDSDTLAIIVPEHEINEETQIIVTDKHKNSFIATLVAVPTVEDNA